MTIKVKIKKQDVSPALDLLKKDNVLEEKM